MLFTYLGYILLGGAIGAAVGYLLAEYLENAKEWFDYAWQHISRITRAVGILYRRGKRLFKAFIVEKFNGEYSTYEPEEDDGVEVDWNELSEAAKKALEEDEYIPVQRYEL